MSHEATNQADPEIALIIDALGHPDSSTTVPQSEPDVQSQMIMNDFDQRPGSGFAAADLSESPTKPVLERPTDPDFAQGLYEQISDEMIDIAEEVAQLTGHMNPVEIYTAEATQMKAQKNTFLEKYNKGERSNPVFEYPVAEKMEVEELRAKIQQLLVKVRNHNPTSPPDRLFRIGLRAKLKDDLATCDLVEGIQQKDEVKISEAMKQKYPPVSTELLAEANRIFDNMVNNRKPEPIPAERVILPKDEQDILTNEEICFNAQDLKEAFEWVLDKYGILRKGDEPHGFKVVISNQVTSIDVRDKSSEPMTIFIPHDREVNGRKLLMLVAHEIEAHARQSANGSERFLMGGGALKMDGEVLYEGLAMWLEQALDAEFFGNASSDPEPYYVFAVQKATEGGSFYDIFEDQFQRRLQVALAGKNKPGFSMKKAIEEAQSEAWRVTYRVMRGHTDTSNPQKTAMSKDLAYLQGWFQQKILSNNNLGYVNEMAIFQPGGLRLLLWLKIALTAEDVPHPFKNETKNYYYEVLKPKAAAKAEALKQKAAAT